MQRSREKTRREHDLLGERELPDRLYYGIQTLRAVENFHTTGVPISHYPDLIRSLAKVKLAAARANRDLGLLPGRSPRPSGKPARRSSRGNCTLSSSWI